MSKVNSEVQNEAKENIEDLDFATMLEESFKKRESVDVIEGTIVTIKDGEVFVDIDTKTEGILNAEEIEGTDFKVGDKIKVVIVGNYGGKPKVSYKKALHKIKVQEFIDNFNPEDDNIFEVKILNKNKGGYICVGNDIECFMPRSQSALKDSKSIIGRSYKVKVLKVDKENQSILVSRKKIVEDERKEKEETINKLLENQEPIEGTVKKITTYGMFVDVGGVDGLVHYSEISYKGPVNPNSLFKEGDKVLVKVVNYDDKKRHLSLSIKAAMPDPWKEIAADGLEVGDTIRVVVSNIEPYGAFVDLGNDIEGFLHISEISWDKNIKNPKDFIKEGENIDVEVIEINLDERRLRVTLKNLLPRPFDEFRKKYKVGDTIKGIVTTVTNFGAFVKIDGVEGLLHNEDASWDRNERCKGLYKQGDEVNVKIIKIDNETQKISLSTKELKDSPVCEYAKNHKVGDIVKGKIRDIKDFGIFLDLGNGVDALIRKEDIQDEEREKLKVGDEIEAAVDFIDERRNRIRLSLKRLSKAKERAVLNKINENDDNVTLGDLIKKELSEN